MLRVSLPLRKLGELRKAARSGATVEATGTVVVKVKVSLKGAPDYVFGVVVAEPPAPAHPADPRLHIPKLWVTQPVAVRLLGAPDIYGLWTKGEGADVTAALQVEAGGEVAKFLKGCHEQLKHAGLLQAERGWRGAGTALRPGCCGKGRAGGQRTPGPQPGMQRLSCLRLVA
ncbi:hypothetical protein ABPG77_006430 [Micractinium sp. CCAP 211/92]